MTQEQAPTGAEFLGKKKEVEVDMEETLMILKTQTFPKSLRVHCSCQ